MGDKTILVIGTYDTKDDEMRFIEDSIRAQGADVLSMDVSVLGDPTCPTDISKHDVAQAAGLGIDEVIALGDENKAIRAMSRGAAEFVRKAHEEGRFDAMLATGGTLGTDLALDCAQALPMGVPKYIVSTVAFSPLIPPHRLAPDIQMILWAGGLYGMNAICRSSLSQAAGAVVGAARAVELPRLDQPLIGMTSLGSSCLSYMKTLKPALEERGFEVAVFHSTGMGGMAFEKLAREGAFCCVMDFCMQEFANLLAGSLVSSGEDRLTNAGASGIPQMVAPGALDLLDYAGWQDIPPRYQDRPFHEHNRLIKSAVLNGEERRNAIREMASRLEAAKGPVHVFLPLGGVEEWDREGQEAHDPEALAQMMNEAKTTMPGAAPTTEINAHINDPEFCDAVLKQFDLWLEQGVVSMTR
jgi:uncharacterized protein (UPF0261 family)